MNRTSISFVVPMYNERGAIADTIKELGEIGKEFTDSYEIIVADDASTDGSASVVDEIAKKDPRVKSVRLAKNTKFGGALKAAIEKAQNDIIVYTDSDMPVERQDIKSAFSALKDCDIVSAFSKVEKGKNLKRIIMSKVYNFLIQALFGMDIKDINSGFKIYRKKVFTGIKLGSKSPFIDVEIFIRALEKKCIIKQYPLVFKSGKKDKSYISRPAVVFKTIQDMISFKIRR
ncbi:MAG: glycosyltransferase family 2 protein [Candidatus Omnitrophica bacterium]|nr:glycosyltransferase family 2 protein [Candidatus Omnitrophota bacterium]